MTQAPENNAGSKPLGAQLPGEPGRSSIIRQCLLVFLCAFFLQGLQQTLPGTVVREDGSEQFGLRSRSLPMGDTPYQIRVAYLYRTGEMAKAGEQFHWMRASIWADRFMDKEFLYHLYLVPFTLGAGDVKDTTALIWGAKLANCVMFGLLALTLFGVLHSFGVRRAWLFVGMMLVLGGISFCSRTEESRAWPLYVICSLAAWLTMAQNRRLSLAVVACVFTLSYAAAHFLLVIWGLRTVLTLAIGPDAGATRKSEIKMAMAQLLAIFAGVLTGVLLHPGRADFAQTWLVTYVMVVLSSMRGPLQSLGLSMVEALGLGAPYAREDAQRLQLGVELLPLAGSQLVLAAGAALACPVFLAVNSAWQRHKPSREAVLALAMGVVTLFMYINSQRFCEVMGPFMALGCGIWVEDWLRNRPTTRAISARPEFFRRWTIAVQVGVLIAVCALWGFVLWSKEPRLPRPWRGAALWLRDNPDARGKMVYHAQWDVFPDLFFYAPQSDYTVGMDPHYLLAHDAGKSNLSCDIVEGKVDSTTLARVLERFKPDYILVLPSVTPAFFEQCQKGEQDGRLKLAFADSEADVRIYEVTRQGN